MNHAPLIWVNLLRPPAHSGTTMRGVIIFGAILLAFSSYPLFLQGREIVVGYRAFARYDVRPIYDATEAGFQGQTITLRDAFMHPRREMPGLVKGPVQIWINGRDYSVAAPAEIQPFSSGSDRYFAWVSLARMKDRVQGEEFLAVVQRVATVNPRNINDLSPLRFRILLVAAGSVKEEVFTFSDRAHPQYRTMLARLVSPQEIGFYSQVLAWYPSVLYPLLYPWLTGLVGIVAIMAGAGGLLLRRRRSSV